MNLQGKVAVITGGTSGMGQATAVLFAQLGTKVVVAGRRQEQGDAVVDQTKSAGGDAFFVKTDVTGEEDVENLIAEAVKPFGRVDIAFNNAGVEGKRPITEFTEEGATKTAALEVAEQNIRIHAVAPAATATDMIARFAGKEGSESRRQLASPHPMNRLATVEEIAGAVAYLASDAASFTTGISLPVDGGILAR